MHFHNLMSPAGGGVREADGGGLFGFKFWLRLGCAKLSVVRFRHFIDRTCHGGDREVWGDSRYQW